MEPEGTQDHTSSRKKGIRYTEGSTTRRWFLGMVCFGGLLALGDWAVSQHGSMWFSANILDWEEHLSWRRTSNLLQVKRSPLGEPWSQIVPRRELVYHPCYDSLYCARLDVPMDWNNTTADGARVSLAIAKLPSKVHVTDPRYGGLLWLQIGGPGGSGIEFLRKHGKTIQTIVDSDLNPSDPYHESRPLRYFDILGIDPRGVNNTTPRLSCFPTSVSRDLWILQSSAEGMVGSSDVSFKNHWARAEALGRGCSARFRESENRDDRLAFHMNTTPVVADMIAVLELHGKWREEEARKWLASRKSYLNEAQRLQITERTRWKENQEKLIYWGFSYGTVIGATFAAMHPHRIERAVMDGVVDSPDYYRGEWLANLQDTDAIMKKMCEYCDEAGPEGCALYTQGGTAAITKRFDEILESIKEQPIGVPASGALAPDLITYSDVKLAIRGALYAPIQDLTTIIKGLIEISHRNGTNFAAAKQQQQHLSVPTPECRDAPPYAQECQVPSVTLGEITTAISCSDGNSTFGMTRSAFKSYVKQLQKQSQLMGESWAQIRMGCIAWDVKPKWRYPGPFAGTTAKPMLIVGTVMDPVTPIRNAYAMAERFDGSAVLSLEAEGHCSLSSPSLCMARYIRRYLQTGQLPASGTLCTPNERPLLGVTDHGEPVEAELLERLMWTARHLP